jgi:hypothetical protein
MRLAVYPFGLPVQAQDEVVTAGVAVHLVEGQAVAQLREQFLVLPDLV